MKLKRLLMPVVVLGIMLGMVGIAEAGMSCTVSSAPVSRAIATGHTEVAGDLTFVCTPTTGATATATLTVDLGVPITNTLAYPTGFPIQITGLTGDFAAVGQAPTISPTGVINTAGQILITLPLIATPSAGPPPVLSSFSLRGVLASLNGSGKSSLTANVSISPGSNYFITAGQNVATVITTILQGLGTPCLGLATTTTTSGGTTTCGTITAGTSSPVALLTNGTSLTGAGQQTWNLSIPENFIDALRFHGTADGTNCASGVTPQGSQISGTCANNDVQIQVALSGIPANVTIGGCSAAATSGAPVALSGATFTSTTSSRTISFGSLLNLTAVDIVSVTCTTIDASTATLPLTAGAITATVTLAPTGTAFSTTTGLPLTTTASGGNVPRYQSSPSSALTVVNIIPATTTFLIPYVTTTSTFDTGLAVSNTTADTFTVGGARAQSGTVTFNFFPVTGSSFSYTTSATSPTGNGGLASGVLASGKTWTVLATELLTAAGFATPRAFSGYIIAVANFTNGHGEAFITDFKGFTSATDVLVMSPPALVPRNIAAPAYVETLGK